MHVIPHNPLFDTLQRGEKVFLEAWFNLTHPQSLDSYRARCHNGRTILAELKREMGIPVAKDTDLAGIALEAVGIADTDCVLQNALGANWKILRGHLDALAKVKEEGKSDRLRTQLDYLLTDTLPDLPPVYLKQVLAALAAAIQAADDEAILRLSSALASDLTTRGWAVASLHSWVETHFLSQSWESLIFSERFRFFAERMQQAPGSYEVVFSLSGSGEVGTIGSFCGVEFSTTVPGVSAEALRTVRNLDKFIRPNAQRSFAKLGVQAVDQFSAVHEAEEKLAKCQDRLRFNFIAMPVDRGRRLVLVTRKTDGKIKLLQSLPSIPSPAHHLKLDDFLAASRQLDRLFSSGQIDDTSRRRIEAAIRHYRLGLDARSYNDMLLNWWMGLETLTNSGGDGRGGIGGKVFTNAVPLLSNRYLNTQLRYLCGVVQAACDGWPPEVDAMLGGPPPKYLSAFQLLQALQTQTVAGAIKSKLAAHPWVELRWDRFCALVGDASKLANYLDEHETRVRWHLQRLYRLRCCLVHGTPVESPLQLPTANLEYYLREAIYVVLEALAKAPQIRSLDAVFDRTQYCSSRRKELLHTKGPAAADAVRGAMQTDLTFRLPN